MRKLVITLLCLGQIGILLGGSITPVEFEVHSLHQYTIQSDVTDGTTAFTDRSYTYRHLPGFLRGQTAIRTPMADRSTQEGHKALLRIKLSEPVTVYIAYDDRYQVLPNWLSSFEVTHHLIALEKKGMETVGVYRLYKKTIPANTEMAFGGNRSNRENGFYGMYTIFLSPVEQASWINVKARSSIPEIYVIDEADGPGKAEPYLFSFFFKWDSEAKMDPRENRSWFNAFGRKGNLGLAVETGESIHPGSSIGQWIGDLRYNPAEMTAAQVQFGVISILIEADEYPTQNIIQTQLFPELEKQIREKIITWQQNQSIHQRDEAEKKLVLDIEGWLSEKFPKGGNADDVIGVAIFSRSLSQLKKEAQVKEVIQFSPSTGSQDGSYNIALELQVFL